MNVSFLLGLISEMSGYRIVFTDYNFTCIMLRNKLYCINKQI